MGITTEQLAEALGLKAQSLRAAVCREGHYYGLRPRRLPNGRLMWPSDSLQRLIHPRAVEVAK
ncbi:DNA-binding protein [Niveibacterium sp. 24ML]|uniref:DNA-binding protein n=1 Tax=Niveibacterium sp. 24ML TaxID=2985512 RepID=UPI00226FAD9E|nr:DNA-binding protein [Niveibacterium sp. 24ML]MCX9155882.1 DNA-binding protein [Niveibacterium sp. 24ML]